MRQDSALIDLISRAQEAGAAVWGPGWIPTRYAAAPGRVEVLGNHVDYNGGPVLAAAIDRSTVVVSEEAPSTIAKREVILSDVSSNAPVMVLPDGLSDWRNANGSQRPADFVRGVAAALEDRDRLVRSGRFVVASSVPIGVGVSSSAALCVALALAMAREPLAFEELVLVAQEAEHRAGTPCGTMDQSVSVAGGMIRFDGSDLSTRQLNPDLKGHAFLVIDSGVRRSLARSSYPARVDECRRALATFNPILGEPLSSLALMTSEDLAQVSNANVDQTLVKRARHVISETERVNQAEAALNHGDLRRFGSLMRESGKSSATDYEISHPVVEELVQKLNALPGVLGARMMGGGEGGSLIALIEPDERGELQSMIESAVNDDRLAGSERRPVYTLNFSPGARKGLIRDLVSA